MIITSGTTVLDETVPARAPWSTVVRAGEQLEIIDLHGNQAVDCLLYAADDHTERYSAQATVTAQRNIFLSTGGVLLTDAPAPRS